MAERLAVLKTYKLYLKGEFPRSESGRTIEIKDSRGRTLAHVCRASKKDLREAVRAAREAQPAWAARTAYNRGQILYRMAEMMEGKADEFVTTLSATVPGGKTRARKEVQAAIDRLVCFGGWADKFTQVLGCANPVAGPFHNFTIPEPTGVIGVIAPDQEPLLALISLIAPPLCTGNTVVALGSEAHPIATAVLGEVCATSDLPGGVVNLLTGLREELLPVFTEHRDLDGLHAAVASSQDRKTLELGAAENLKRVRVHTATLDWYDERDCHSPYWIEPFVEMKTLWHPSAT
ncbi:MAG: aldehyde dehydrogenase family protein [Planctomycetota bacterium]|nr:MAG: aldehyde dehydrogenase family protein [Planctomycetota bacterium]